MFDLLLPAGVVAGLDQMTKVFVVSRLREGQAVELALGIRIRRLTNVGAPGGWRPLALVLTWVVAAAVVLVLGTHVAFLERRVAHIGLGSALGGAASNVIDRLRRGGVVDFVDLRVWPVFNLADVAIVAGVAAALWCAW